MQRTQTSEDYTEALAAAVARRDLPRAAFCVKELLKRRAHAKLRTGIVMGLGMAVDVDERYAQSVCEILSELQTCDVSVAASALTTCMKSVSLKKLSNVHNGSTGIINADAVERAMGKSGGDEDMAHLMANALGVNETSAVLARACARNGRDPTALTILAKCSFLKQHKRGAMKILMACVRASRTKRSDIVKVCVNAALVKELDNSKNKADGGGSDGGGDGAGVWNTEDCARDSVDEELKIAALWTYVPKKSEAMIAVEQASNVIECSATDIKIIEGFNVPEPSTRVSMIQRS
jgi:hypothetical protein